MMQQNVNTILVVDDEQLVADLTRDVLQRFGYTVLVAGNGEDAVSVYQQKGREISVVVLDLVMPGASGSEVFRRLRSLNPEVRVVISSGNGHDADAAELLRQGAIGFVKKPYRIADLLTAVGKRN